MIQKKPLPDDCDDLIHDGYIEEARAGALQNGCTEDQFNDRLRLLFFEETVSGNFVVAHTILLFAKKTEIKLEEWAGLQKIAVKKIGALQVLEVLTGRHMSVEEAVSLMNSTQIEKRVWNFRTQIFNTYTNFLYKFFKDAKERLPELARLTGKKLTREQEITPPAPAN